MRLSDDWNWFPASATDDIGLVVLVVAILAVWLGARLGWLQKTGTEID